MHLALVSNTLGVCRPVVDGALSDQHPVEAVFFIPEDMRIAPVAGDIERRVGFEEEPGTDLRNAGLSISDLAGGGDNHLSHSIYSPQTGIDDQMIER